MRSAIAKLVDSTTAKIEGKVSGAISEAKLAKVRSCRVALCKAIARLEIESGEQSIYIVALVEDIEAEMKRLKK